MGKYIPNTLALECVSNGLNQVRMFIINKVSPKLPMGIRASIIAAASLSLVAGCDTGPSVAPVHGNVLHKGKTVTTGTVTFYPVGGGRAAVGAIKTDGTYTLSRKEPGDGVVVGEYKVAIEATEAVEGAVQKPETLADELAAAPRAFTAPAGKHLIPAKYSTVESSGLTAIVETGNNEIDFDLP